MSLLTELLGNDDALWMSNPENNCAPPAGSTAKDVQTFADMWFPSETGETKYAKRLCAGCPSRTNCLQYALDNPDLEGIFGGTSTSGRMALRGGKGHIPPSRPACGTTKGYEAHRRAKEATCTPCRAAWNEYRQSRRAGAA